MGIIHLVIIVILYALSFLVLDDLPMWIANNSNLNAIFYIVLNSMFGIAFIYYATRK